MDWWVYVLGVVVFVAILGIIVLIHEGGHFIMAKRAGILCHEFSIGMGPVLFQKKIGETTDFSKLESGDFPIIEFTVSPFSTV